MKQSVILLSDIPGLGQVGDECKVKNGFAGNYLLPQQLAILATPDARRKLEKQKEKINTAKEKQLAAAKALAEKVSHVGLVFERPVGHGGRLFGSVTPFDIVSELAKQGATIEKKCVLMHAAIKTMGDHSIRVRLHSQVVVDVPVNVKGTEDSQKRNIETEMDSVVDMDSDADIEKDVDAAEEVKKEPIQDK